MILAKGANGPTTPEADDILADKGVLIIPEILCNAVCVKASYFEWVQYLQSFFWSEDEIEVRLKRIMVGSINSVMAVAKRRKVSIRVVAQCPWISRLVDAAKVRGIYPCSFSYTHVS